MRPMTDDAIARLLGRVYADSMIAAAVETLAAGRCPPEKLSDAHIRWFRDRLSSVGVAAFREATSAAAMSKPTDVFAKGFTAAMAAAGRQVAEEFLAGEWGRQD